MKKTLIRPISLFAFSSVVSVGTLLLYNIPFFSYVADSTNEALGGKALLLSSLVVIMLALNFMTAYLTVFLLRIVGRILLAILSLINATALYFIITYNVIIDATTIENVFNTRYSEASAFFCPTLALFIVVVGLLPALYCLLQPVVMGSAKRMGLYCGSALAIALLAASLNISQTLWITQHDTELGGLLQPWSYIVNTCRILSSRQDQNAEEIKLPDGTIADHEKAVVILVIGESARKANFQLYGYQRDTNPLLSKQQGLKVYEATSCATYTTAGTKAILEPKNSDQLYELLPNYAFRTGVDVSWRTSNWGEPPIHIDEYLTDTQLAETTAHVGTRRVASDSVPGRENGRDTSQGNGRDTSQGNGRDTSRPYDGILFAGLRERIESSNKDKVLIILHTSTSHGPKYADKYPEQFQVYKPVARNVEEGQKDIPRLINAYDNTIRYTDFLLDSLINTLRAMKDRNSALIFISDHGESLGENNIFMHGLPMKLAPKVQYEIPFIVWVSDGFRTYKKTSAGEKAPAGQLPPVLDQHYVFHSVLNLLSIQSPAYDKDLDIFELVP